MGTRKFDGSPAPPARGASIVAYFVCDGLFSILFAAVMRPHEGNHDVDCPADSNYCGDSDDEDDPERLLDVWLGELDSLASVNTITNTIITPRVDEISTTDARV